MTLVSSEKFTEKAEEVLREGLEHLPNKPTLTIVEKRRQGNGRDYVQLVTLPMNKGGMMLYTSGTTSRPVSVPTFGNRAELTCDAEGCTAPDECSHSPVRFPSQGLGVHG